MDLADFLLARLSDEETGARDAMDAARDGGDGASLGDLSEAGWAFYKTHDPARVLADCAARRAIVEASTEAAIDAGLALADPVDQDDWCIGADAAYLLVMRHLASVYRDHPDYNPAWTP